MENIPVASWILWLSSMIGAVTAIAGAVLGMSKKARNGFKKLVRKNADADEIKEALNALKAEIGRTNEMVERIDEENRKQRDAHLATLRNAITSMYYKHLEDKKLAAYEKEDLLKMYDVYKAWHGNTYVHTIVGEMTNWDVKT